MLSEERVVSTHVYLLVWVSICIAHSYDFNIEYQI